MRNSATFSPVVAALFWPVVTKRAVIASLFMGFTSGLLWYYLGDWQPSEFYLNIHPVWIGSSINIITIVITTLFDRKSNWMINAGHRIKRGYATVAAFVSVTVLSIIYFERLHEMGLTGLLLFIMSLLFFIEIGRAHV